MALNLAGLSQDEQFKQAAAYAGVPESVLRGMWRVESANGTNMRSEAGAQGHFQQMPDITAEWSRRAGRQLNPDDFGDSLTMAAMQMKENMGIAKGDVVRALRFYHGGMDQSKWGPVNAQYASNVMGTGDMDTSAFSVRNVGREAPMLSMEEVWNTSASDIRNGQIKDMTSGAKSNTALSAELKGLQDQVGVEAAVAALLSGNDPLAATTAARAGVDQQTAEAYLAESAAKPRVDLNDDVAWNRMVEREDAAAKAQKDRDALGFGDKFTAAFDSNTLTAALWHVIEDQYSGVKYSADPNYKPNTDDIFGWARNEDEIEAQMEANSVAELNKVRRDLERERDNQRVLSTSSGAGQLGYNLLAGVADPVGWAAGLGVGKAFQLAGVGARAAFAAGQTAKGFALAAGEGAVGNVLMAAALDAAGQHQTTNDYAFAAGTGMLFGAAFGSFDYLGTRGDVGRQQMRELADQMRNDATQLNSDLYARAQGNLGPNATAEAIAQEADRLQMQDMDNVMKAVLNTAPDMDQILPKVTPEVHAQARQVGGNGELPKELPGAILTSPAQRKAIIDKYGLETSISDGAERLLAAEMYARAERWIAENPIDSARLNNVLAKAGIESTAARMLLSENPLMKMVGGVLLENAQGATQRRVTASMTAKVRERVYIGNAVNQYERLYESWRKAQGRTGFHDFIDGGKKRAEFDKLVYQERETRFQGKLSTESDEAVLGAGKLLDDAYERMRKDQRWAGTLGSERLSDEAVAGFTSRKWALGKVRGMNRQELRAFRSEVARQFKLLTDSDGAQKFDDAFAERFSREYVEVIRSKAMAQYEVPMNLHDTDAADFVRDALKSMGVAGIDPDKLLERFSRGGASHTKGRLDLDLTHEFVGEGNSRVRLLDFIDTDNLSLLRNYARRTAGEVSLSKYGIMGEPGLREVRTAMQAAVENGKVTAADLESFDQIAAEFLGKPFGGASSKWADNARIMTSAIRLGGMGFTQAAEAANGFAAIGFTNSLKAVGSWPRLLKEVKQIAKGEKVDGILSSLELYTGELGMDGYRMQGLYDVNDGFEVYGKESLDRFSKAVRLGNHGVRVLSAHRAILAVQTRGMAEQIALKALRYIRNGGEDAALADMGFTPDLVRRLRGDLPRIAEFQDGRATRLNLLAAEDQDAANAFAQAVQRGASQIIQETYIGETGKWAHDGFLKLLFQFRTFSLTSVEKQWGRQKAVHGAGKALAYTLGAMSFAAPIHMARVSLRSTLMQEDRREDYLERELNPLSVGRATMNYVSALGLLPDVVDAGFSIAGYDSTGGRAQFRSSFVGGSIAPAAGVANDIADVLKTRDPKKAINLLPGNNIPHMAAAFNLLEAGAQDFKESMK